MSKVLMISTQEIVNDLSDGGKKGSNRNWKLLQDVFGKENVSLIMYTNYQCDRMQANIERLQSYSGKVNRVFNIISGRLFSTKKSEDAVLEKICKEKFDLIFLDRTLYGNLIVRVRQNCPDIKIWTFSHNLEAYYFKNKFKKLPLIGKVVCHCVKESEKKTVQLSNELFVLTERDRELNYKCYGKSSIVMPTTFPDVYNPNKRVNQGRQSSKKQLLFIGTMFGPNYDGIKWFVDEVMPKLTDYKLTIVGKNFEQRKTVLERKNVEVIGTVKDLEVYYYAQNIMVMPIFYGDGQKVKTAEAMMYGKVILASDEALEGYSVNGVKGVFRCNTVEDYVNTLRKIDFAKLNEYSIAVRDLFVSKYSYAGLLDDMTPKLKKLIS